MGVFLRSARLIRAAAIVALPIQNADATMTLELDSSGGTVLQIADNSALDGDGTVDVITFVADIDGGNLQIHPPTGFDTN